MFLTSKLTSMGYAVRRCVIIPDDGSVKEEIERAVPDSDVILLTGGLGPTSDDITREVVASLAGVPLEKNTQVWNRLYDKIGDRIYGANEVQTLFPKGFTVIDNPLGTAAGFSGFLKRDRAEADGGGVLIFCMPGPPREMQPMFINTVEPALADYIGRNNTGTDEYSVFLLAEARLEDLCRQVKLVNGLDGVSWGTRFQDCKISLYVNGENAGERRLFAEKLRAIAGKGLIADGCTEAVQILVNTLREKNYLVSTAESATSGLLAKLLTDIPGSSAWYWGGVNSYSADAKIKMLSVNEKEIKEHGMVTLECAKEMAEGVLRISGADLGVSITGIAGPSGEEEGKPLGTVCIGCASVKKNGEGASSDGADCEAVMVKMSHHTRESGRRRFAVIALILANFYLLGVPLIDIVSTWNYI